MKRLSPSAVFVAFTFAFAAFAAPALGQGYASSVAVSGGQLLLPDQGGVTGAGAVHVFERSDEGSWVESGSFTSESAEGFGQWINVSGDQALVGARGSVVVFTRRDGSWSESSTLTADAGQNADGDDLVFGVGGAAAGNVALVAAGIPAPRGYRGNGAMKVFVFEMGEDGWTQSAELNPPAEAGDDAGFGSVVLTDGENVAVAAPGADVDGEAGAGAVYYYAKGDEGWSHEGTLTADEPFAGQRFGSALHLYDSGGTLVVLAGTSLGQDGTVYSAAWVDGAWESGPSYPPPVGGRQFRGFDRSVSLASSDGELLIGGAYIATGFKGQVAVYGGSMSPFPNLLFDVISAPTDEQSRDQLGSAISVEGDLAAVSALGNGGSVYVMERTDGEWAITDEVWVEAANYAAISGGEVSCGDNGLAQDFACEEIDILSYMTPGDLGGGRAVNVNDVWGWTDPETKREYALVGMTDQTSFVDITDPENPVYLGRLPMTDGARGSVWRDIKVYENHAFIVSDGAGQHGMQVFDLTRLRDVGGEPETFAEDALYSDIASAHNIVINEGSGYAYSVGTSGGGESCGGGLHMIDIREPTTPSFAGCFAHENTGRTGTGYSHDALCLIYGGPDTEHVGREICIGSNENAISIADVTDKSAPIALSTVSVGDGPSGYWHQGWVTEDHRYFYLGDELDEIAAESEAPFSGTRTIIFDIEDLDDPLMAGEYFGVSTSSDHNLYIVGDRMYQANYNSGLRILDISDPLNPVEVAYLDTVPHSEGPAMDGAWSNYPFFASGTILVTSGAEGLFMVRHREQELVP